MQVGMEEWMEEQIKRKRRKERAAKGMEWKSGEKKGVEEKGSSGKKGTEEDGMREYERSTGWRTGGVDRQRQEEEKRSE